MVYQGKSKMWVYFDTGLVTVFGDEFSGPPVAFFWKYIYGNYSF